MTKMDAVELTKCIAIVISGLWMYVCELAAGAGETREKQVKVMNPENTHSSLYDVVITM